MTRWLDAEEASVLEQSHDRLPLARAKVIQLESFSEGPVEAIRVEFHREAVLSALT